MDAIALRDEAVAAARPIFYRPERIVAELLARFVALPEAEFPGLDGVRRACYEEPVRMGATSRVFALRALHWPMLNLLDAADRQRREFADALAAAVYAARTPAA